ncbi:ATP-binding protein (plasmid) [Bradyrhizobium sp. CB82]|nr:ATP-binding protein [Bradyrhizobium sp. CB82]WFU46135.1 ATP-binding protein [Bradyrhizobium sp. CB82]
MSCLTEDVGELMISTSSDISDCVLVSVRDTGSGVPLNMTERFFEAFYTRKSEGMGIGLAIRRSIIEAHGVRPWVVALRMSRGGLRCSAFSGGAEARDSSILRLQDETSRFESLVA